MMSSRRGENAITAAATTTQATMIFQGLRTTSRPRAANTDSSTGATPDGELKERRLSLSIV
jgi:hypothetical protein